MPKITVAVPVYNVEEYVAKCLDSLVRQTFQDFVVYVVNDGSPANEQVIIDEYAAKYPELIKPIVKENGGYGSVLQYCINNLETDYLLVCDPDDWLEDNTLEILYNKASESNADLVVGAKTLVFSDNDELKYDPSYQSRFGNITSGQLYTKQDEEYQRFFFMEPSPHAKLYKHDIIKDIKFVEKVGYTDNLLYFIGLLNSERVVYLEESLAYYLIDRAGNSSTDVRAKTIDARVSVFKEIITQASNIKNVQSIFYYRMFSTFKYINDTSENIGGTKEEYINSVSKTKELLDLIIPYKKDVMKYYNAFENIPTKNKVVDKLLLNNITSTNMFSYWVNKRANNKYK